MPRVLTCLIALSLLLGAVPLALPDRAAGLATLPAGFNDSLFASGFGGRLTTMTFAPGGRLFVSEKQGSVRIVKNGALQDDPFLTVATATDSEKGLKGIAFDPDYAANGFVYVYYTDAVTLKNKVSRFTTSSDPDLADSTTELVLVDGIDSGIFHSGGALHFGPDGKLYVSTGDASYAPNGQNLGNLNGKILRINSDGTIPDDNPFVDQAGKRGEIWAYGLRNPYTFAFDPTSDRLFINDVGNSTWEEINDGRVGANYGWPTCEGVCNDPQFTDPVYAYNHADGPGKSITGAVFYRGSMFPAAYAGDFFFGDYVGNYIKRFVPATGQVIGFATNAPNPVDLDVGPDGALYYLSVEKREIHRISYGETSPPPPPPPPPPDGNLLVNGGFESTTGWPSPWVWKVRSPAQATRTRSTDVVRSGVAAARIDISAASSDWYVQLNQPNVNLTADRSHTLTFAARASGARSIRLAFHRNSAPYPIYFERVIPITSEWATYSVSFTPTTSDTRALLALNLGGATGQIWLDDMSLTAAQSNDESPVPTIDTPVAGATYRAGDRVDFSGAATDLQDGDLPPEQLTWEVVFHHDDHTHPHVEPFTGQSEGSFLASDTGEASANVWYRIHLTAVDSAGNRNEVTRDVRPVTSTVTLATQPAGLRLDLDGSPVTAPHTFAGVAGFQREIAAPLTQTVAGVAYRFVSWSDGGAATHTISTPGGSTTLTASYASDASFANPGFESTGSGWLTPWRFTVRSPAGATVSRDTASVAAGNASARININAASSDWHVQLLQPNVPLAAGAPHTLTFWARASSARPIRIAFHRNSAPYPVYFERSVAVSTVWARYDVIFTPPSDDSRSLFAFNVGANTGSLWIDSVSLTH